jgi:hypothetical protein
MNAPLTPLVASQLDGRGCQASMSYKTYFDTPEVRVCCTCANRLRLLPWYPVLTLELADVSQHSHEIGHVNLPFTRRGRRAQAASKAAVAGSNPSVPPASPSQPGVSCLQPNQTTGQVGAPIRTQPEITQAFSSSYPHFPSMSMPIPQGFGAVTQLPATSSAPAPPPVSVPALTPTPTPHPFPVPSPNQPVVTDERERMERERWDRMDVLYQNIRNNARQFEYPAASVAALESVLVRMYFESPIPAPHPQPGPPFTYAPAAVPLPHAVPMQQPEQIAVGEGGRSDGTSESGGDEEDEEQRVERGI